MKEISKTFSDIAIRNAIGGFLLCTIFIYAAIRDEKTGLVLYFLLLIIPSFWLLIGLDLRKKYKVFPEQKDFDKSALIKFNKIMDLIFFILLVLVWVFRTKKMVISDYLLGIVFILYTIWTIYKWREISKAFKQN